ncbi:MAG: DUF5320 domain-containing protein [Candidatus Omnitrophota bacterium]
MPGFDTTGPRGQGPMTGGARGYCAMAVAGAGRAYPRGSYGRGGARGRRNRYYATGLPGWVRAEQGMQAFGGFAGPAAGEDEMGILKGQAEMLRQELQDIQARIEALESAKKSDLK